MPSKFNKINQFYDKLLKGETNFSSIDLSEALLDRLMITQPCDFSNASFEGSTLIKAHLSKVLMDGANFSNANLANAVLKYGIYQKTIFNLANLTNANFFKSNLKDAIFSGTTLISCSFQKADLRGTDFRNVDISQAIFTEAVYSGKTLFDANINPQKLGMIKEETEENLPHAKAKTRMYRGQPVMALEPSTADKASPAEAKPVMKEINYRGVKTLVEVKQVHTNKHKSKMTYRGISQ